MVTYYVFLYNKYGLLKVCMHTSSIILQHVYLPTKNAQFSWMQQNKNEVDIPENLFIMQL